MENEKKQELNSVEINGVKVLYPKGWYYMTKARVKCIKKILRGVSALFESEIQAVFLNQTPGEDSIRNIVVHRKR